MTKGSRVCFSLTTRTDRQSWLLGKGEDSDVDFRLEYFQVESQMAKRIRFLPGLSTPEKYWDLSNDNFTCWSRQAESA